MATEFLPAQDRIGPALTDEDVEAAAVETERRIADIKRVGAAVERSKADANLAEQAARAAKDKSAGLGRKKVAIEALQEAGVQTAVALSSVAESQKHLFESQQLLATYTQALTTFALGSVANTRAVFHTLREKLANASEADLSETARRELQAVMEELREQVDLADRLGSAEKNMRALRDESERQGAAISDAVDEHAALHKAAALTRTNTADLAAMLERLNEVELLSGNTASALAAEVSSNEQRDASITRLYELADAAEDAARDAARTSAATIGSLRTLLIWAIGLAVLGTAVGLAALVLVLLIS